MRRPSSPCPSCSRCSTRSRRCRSASRYSARPLRPSRIPSRAISNDPPLAVNSPNPAGSHATVETSPRPSRRTRGRPVLNAGSYHGRLRSGPRAAAAYLSLADHGHVEDALEMGIPHRRHQQPPHEWPSCTSGCWRERSRRETDGSGGTALISNKLYMIMSKCRCGRVCDGMRSPYRVAG